MKNKSLSKQESNRFRELLQLEIKANTKPILSESFVTDDKMADFLSEKEKKQQKKTKEKEDIDKFINESWENKKEILSENKKTKKEVTVFDLDFLD